MPSRLRAYEGRTILVVDDNGANVALMTALLARHGLTRVHGVTDSRLAAAELAERRPDLIVLDLHMPHVDGYEVLRQVQAYAAGRYLPVIVMTADSTADARNRALELGAHDFLVKPIDADEAALRIANLLRTRELYEQARAIDPAQVPPDQHDAVADRIRRALSDDGSSVVYQPIVEISTMEVVGLEALTRFRESGFGGPDSWFADAARVGMAEELELCSARRAWTYLSASATDAFLAVNLSPSTVVSHGEALESLPSLDRVVIELTEHERVEDYTALHRALASLRQRGARMAADDLGSGVANLRHLIRLEPDIIKLDRSLVAGVHASSEQCALIRSLVGFAQEVGSVVIAEGVEEPEELAALRSLEVPWAQGYLLGRPEAR